MYHTSRNKGFTLIELLVVISIIGILSSVLLVSLNSARSKARDARRLADIRQVQLAMELFYNDNLSYPDDGGATPTMTDGTPAFSALIVLWPTAPTPADGTCSSAENTYTYQGRNAADTADDPTDPAFYQVGFCLGSTTGSYLTGPHIARPTGIN